MSQWQLWLSTPTIWALCVKFQIYCFLGKERGKKTEEREKEKGKEEEREKEKGKKEGKRKDTGKEGGRQNQYSSVQHCL